MRCALPACLPACHPCREALPAEVMSAALSTHNACMRKVASAHRGYEALTEGDSFVLAFPTPQARGALLACTGRQGLMGA